jgi:tetratricopeptide (TPR) repeat protein
MKRDLVITIGVAFVCGMCVVLAASRSVAEPILGEDSLIGPSDTSIDRVDATDAMALFKAHDYEGALKVWKQAAHRNVDLPPAQVIMTHLFLESRMTKEAQRAIEQAAIDDPKDPEVYLLMAGLAANDLSKADAMLKKANDLLPGFTKSERRKKQLTAQIIGGRASVTAARGDWAGSQQALEEFLKLDPKNVVAMQRLAYCLMQLKDSNGALAKLRTAAKLNPKMLPPETVMAQFCQRARDQEGASKWMAAAVAASPKDIGTRLAASQWALELGDLDEARNQAVEAARINPKSFDTKILQGTIAVFEKNFLAAELFFDSALKQAPDNLAVSNNLALVLAEQNEDTKHRRALELAEANLKRFPKMPEVASTYGLVLYRLGRLDDAEKALKGAASIADSDLDTAYAMALVAMDRGRKAEAIKLLETGLKNRKAAMFRRDATQMLAKLKK